MVKDNDCDDAHEEIQFTSDTAEEVRENTRSASYGIVGAVLGYGAVAATATSVGVFGHLNLHSKVNTTLPQGHFQMASGMTSNQCDQHSDDTYRAVLTGIAENIARFHPNVQERDFTRTWKGFAGFQKYLTDILQFCVTYGTVGVVDAQAIQNMLTNLLSECLESEEIVINKRHAFIGFRNTTSNCIAVCLEVHGKQEMKTSCCFSSTHSKLHIKKTYKEWDSAGHLVQDMRRRKMASAKISQTNAGK